MVKMRLALASVMLLLLMVVVAITVGGYMASECVPQYTLILADGEEFDFSRPGMALGSGTGLVPLEGHDDLPSLSHVSTNIYGTPGQLLLDVSPDVRVVTLTASLYSTDGTQRGLLRAKGQLLDALRWDRGDRDEDPVILRATLGDDSWDLNLNYSNMITSRQGRHGRNEVIGVRLIAYDPAWRSSEESSMVLDFEDIVAMRLVMAREAGVWNAMGPPAVVGVGIAATDIYAAAVDPLTGDVYFGGDFTGFGGVGNNADYLARWTGAVWQPVGDNGAGGPALNERVECLYFGPDNLLYVGGRFTNAGGVANADYIATVDVTTDTWAAPAAAPNEVAGRIVYDVIMDNDGYIYVTGNFTNWSGLGSPAGDYIARALPGGAWGTVGNGLNGIGYCLAKAPNGDIVVGGAFTTAGGVAHNRIVWRDLSAGAWIEMDDGSPGGGTAIWNAEFAPDGTLYVTGNCPTMGSGPTTVNNFARWQGSQWQACGSGLDNIGYGLVVDDDGSAYVTGAFTLAGGLVVDRIARYNGYSWAYVDIVLPVTGNFYRGLAIAENGNLYLGTREVGNATVAGDNSVVNLGSAFTLPVIEIENYGVLKSIVNETTGQELMFNLTLQDGEVLVIDLSTGQKTIESTWRGNRLGDLLPNSDLGIFDLESAPRAQYGAVDGANLITVFITGGVVGTDVTIRWTPAWWSLDEAIRDAVM